MESDAKDDSDEFHQRSLELLLRVDISQELQTMMEKVCFDDTGYCIAQD